MSREEDTPRRPSPGRPEPGPVEAVIFDWGGTLTPWHSIDLGEQWRVFAREIHGIPFASEDVPHADLERAHELADRILAAEDEAWQRSRSDHASAHLDDAPTSAVYVGDRLFEDVLGPQEVGMRTIWVPHSEIPLDQQIAVEVEPDATVQDLGEILGVVEGWLAQA